MIILPNGYKFKYMAASGALGFDVGGWPWERPLCWLGWIDPSLFMVVTKTLTRLPRKGNPRWYLCVRYLRGGGFVNALGLPNPGIDWWCKHIGPSVNSKTPLVVSIFSDDVGELSETASMLNKFINIAALEFNASCPNDRENLQNANFIVEGCKTLSKVSSFPIILKLSVAHKIEEIVPNVEGIIRAVSVNSVPWEIFSNRKSPFAHLGGGGVSGKVAQAHTWRLVKKLVGMTFIPVIGPSVWDYEDIAELRRLGASAISFGSVSLRNPCRPTRFVRRDIEEERELDKLLNNL